MADSGKSSPARYFGRQVRRARAAAGWTLAEFGQRTGYDAGQVSRIETGRRPPTEMFAACCDRVFPDRAGWFAEFYAESRLWLATPAWFRGWTEHEQRTAVLCDWQPAVVTGLLQTEGYARAVISAGPGVTAEQVSGRLAARMARQAILAREDPPSPAATFLVDIAALRRCTGTAEVMSAQCAHLAGVARLPNITIQLVPDIAHAGLLGGFAIADAKAAYVESVVAGQVFEDTETVTALTVRFGTIRAEALRASESLTLIERMREAWKTGESPAIAGTMAETA
jgi:hypothetical protein